VITFRRRKRASNPKDFPIDVVGSGAVLLGPNVTCDGFHADRIVRVQTHIHSDHMGDFTTSMRGEVVMTHATRRLLEYEHPALRERANVRTLDWGQEFEYQGQRIQLISSDHSLGAAQVKVTLKEGIRLGYSGDFNWPLQDVIKVDALVLDATYGNPSSVKRCAQEVAQEALVGLVRKVVRCGPIHLMGDTGPLERGLLALKISGIIDRIPIIASRRACWYAQVHEEYRLPMPPMICDDSPEAFQLMRTHRYIRVWSLFGRVPNDGLYDGTTIRLTKYRTKKEPIEQTAADVYHVGFSNHADFAGTIEYVQATGASLVVTDNHRGQENERALQLAKMIRTQLGIAARVSSNTESRKWGE
jgi:putative mRNA 3-end processing factor